MANKWDKLAGNRGKGHSQYLLEEHPEVIGQCALCGEDVYTDDEFRRWIQLRSPDNVRYNPDIVTHNYTIYEICGVCASEGFEVRISKK